MEATSRMKDFFDIYYLSGVFDFEGRKLQEAISCTLDHRGNIYKSNSFDRIKSFKNNTLMINLWNNYQSGTKENKPDFHVVIEQLEKFLEPIFHAVIEEKEWFYTWDSSVQKWIPCSEKL